MTNKIAEKQSLETSNINFQLEGEYKSINTKITDEQIMLPKSNE